VDRVAGIRRVGLGHHRDDRAFDRAHDQITVAARRAAMSESE
jgi:hypothetical protein